MATVFHVVSSEGANYLAVQATGVVLHDAQDGRAYKLVIDGGRVDLVAVDE